MSSYSWNNKSSLNQNSNDSKVARQANLRDNVSDVSDSSASKKVAKTESKVGRKRRKIKNTKVTIFLFIF